MRLLLLTLLTGSLGAQEPPKGTVVVSSDHIPGATAMPKAAAVAEVTTAERDAWTFTSYDLDVHLVPAETGITVRARLTLRNDGTEPLRDLPLQISSTLTWESVADEGGRPLAFAQQPLDTDADHTGRANEAVVTLPEPLAPGASVVMTAFYSGTIQPSAKRLERIGAPPEQASLADWDGIAPELTALRGFGDVLWYPVVAQPVFMGDGAKLFQAVGSARLRQEQAIVHLRLAVQYAGDPPDAAFFCGRRAAMVAVPDDPNLPIAKQTGVATADFEAAPLGFRSPSLFVIDRAPTVTDDTLIAAVTDHYDRLPAYAAGAALVRPLLTEWLGLVPRSQLNLIDHPGQPFEDDAFAVLPMQATGAATLAPSLVHLLTHAWFRSAQPWLDEGVPQFLSLLWMERSKGRDAAVAALQGAANTLALAEPEIPRGADAAPLGQPLIAAHDEVYYRTKAAAVLWMLRSLVGDDALKQALQQLGKNAVVDPDPKRFQMALERAAHKDLRWFFDDWVYRDRGLPDLTIAAVTPRELPAQGGRAGGWLVAVEVRNDGDAVADVPVTVSSGTLTTSERLRIAGRSSASTRILFGGVPEEVRVNDGTVPEMRTSEHAMRVK